MYIKYKYYIIIILLIVALLLTFVFIHSSDDSKKGYYYNDFAMISIRNKCRLWTLGHKSDYTTFIIYSGKLGSLLNTGHSSWRTLTIEIHKMQNGHEYNLSDPDVRIGYNSYANKYIWSIKSCGVRGKIKILHKDTTTTTIAADVDVYLIVTANVLAKNAPIENVHISGTYLFDPSENIDEQFVASSNTIYPTDMVDEE